MPSNLRYSVSSFTEQATVVSRPTSPLSAKKQKMSLTQTYYLAHTARGKLSKEAARADHELRLLVGHANLLDGLMLDLADAEREQESWFNQTVKGAAKASEEPKHIQWVDTIPEEAVDDMDEEDWDAEAEASDNESSDSSDDEDSDYVPAIPARRIPQQSTMITTTEVYEDEMDEDDDYDEDLALTRTSSAHPPELLHESDSESDDESMPQSPPQPEIPLDAFSQKQRQAIATTSFYESVPVNPNTAPASLPESEQASFFDEGFYLPQRQQAAMAY